MEKELIKNHYYLAFQRRNDNNGDYSDRVDRGQVSQIAVANLLSIDEVDLRIAANKAVFAFQYRIKGSDWQALIADADATMILYTVDDGLFLGATVGPHVRMD